jgi:iron complex transport system ATP-binding protein
VHELPGHAGAAVVTAASVAPGDEGAAPASGPASAPLARLRGVAVTVDGATILDDVDLDVAAGGHLAVLGPNGAGKTTLLRVLSTYRFPTRGSVEVLGVTFGRGDLRPLRARVAFVSVGLDPLLHARATALPLVAAARKGWTWPPRDILGDDELRSAAERALARVGAGHLGARRVDTLSQGERQRVRIARALATDPELVLLDEPFAGLDLGGRETLLADLDALLAEPGGPTVVLVTHHLEELPQGMEAAVLLRGGRVVASGPIGEVLTDVPVSAAFGVEVAVRQDARRFTAVVRPAAAGSDGLRDR